MKKSRAILYDGSRILELFSTGKNPSYNRRNTVDVQSLPTFWTDCACNSLVLWAVDFKNLVASYVNINQRVAFRVPLILVYVLASDKLTIILYSPFLTVLLKMYFLQICHGSRACKYTKQNRKMIKFALFLHIFKWKPGKCNTIKWFQTNFENWKQTLVFCYSCLPYKNARQPIDVYF